MTPSLAGKSKHEMWVWTQLYLSGPHNANAFKFHLQQSYWVFRCESHCGFGQTVREKNVKSKRALLPHLENDVLGEQHTQRSCSFLSRIMSSQDSEGQHEYPLVHSGCWQHMTCMSQGMVRAWQADGVMGLLHFC